MVFDANIVKHEIVEWIRNWFDKNGPGCNAVVGVSGGKDSTVVAALCVEALGTDRVIGVIMPNVEQDDIDVARRVGDVLGIRYIELNIGSAVNGILHAAYDGKRHGRWLGPADFTVSKQAIINLPSRIRMATLYFVSQSYNGRVANTCNLSEDWVGYSTRYGDSVGDFSPLSDLTTDEVIEVGRACGIPEDLLSKVPSDGLCGLSDEDNLGFTYKVLNEYIRTGVCEDQNVKEKIDSLHAKNAFKMKPMPSYNSFIPVSSECNRRW